MDCKSREERALRLARAVKLVLAGDVNAYEEIYTVCDRALRSFVGRRYGHLGDDFVREVAIRTHEYSFSHLSDYRSDRGAGFQTWLNWQSFNVAAQVVAERYERRFGQRVEAHSMAYIPSVAGSDVTTVSERDRILRREFKALAEDDRVSIALHDLGGWTFAETARRIRATVAKTRWARYRGLKRLRARLEELGIRPVEVDTTPVPIWRGWDTTGCHSDYTTSATAVLPEEQAGESREDVEDVN